jgi:hypothetical protein
MTVLIVDPSAVVALLKSELGWEALALRLHAAASRVLSVAGRPPARWRSGNGQQVHHPSSCKFSCDQNGGAGQLNKHHLTKSRGWMKSTP